MVDIVSVFFIEFRTARILQSTFARKTGFNLKKSKQRLYFQISLIFNLFP